MTRRDARRQALSLVFEMNFNDNTVEEMVENALIFRDEKIDSYAESVAEQCRLHWDEIMEVIGKYSRKWKTNRLPKISLAILQTAVAEIVYVKDAPVGAIINEAVELAKEFGSEEDASYINGVLGGFVRDAGYTAPAAEAAVTE